MRSCDALCYSWRLLLYCVTRLYCELRIVGLCGKPALKKDAERDPKRKVTKGPHDARAKLLILQCRKPTRNRAQMRIRSIEGCRSKAEQRSQHNVLGDCNS